jgi:hypothetical protein
MARGRAAGSRRGSGTNGRLGPKRGAGAESCCPGGGAGASRGRSPGAPAASPPGRGFANRGRNPMNDYRNRPVKVGRRDATSVRSLLRQLQADPGVSPDLGGQRGLLGGRRGPHHGAARPCRWIFEMPGAAPGDSLDDLYPGARQDRPGPAGGLCAEVVRPGRCVGHGPRPPSWLTARGAQLAVRRDRPGQPCEAGLADGEAPAGAGRAWPGQRPGRRRTSACRRAGSRSGSSLARTARWRPCPAPLGPAGNRSAKVSSRPVLHIRLNDFRRSCYGGLKVV